MDQQTGIYRNLPCKFCEGTFSSRQSLANHVRRHKKGLACSVCGRLFDRQYTLTNHLKKYADEVPYECDTCHKKFHVESARDVHMLTHGDENPFVCKVCGKHFRRRQPLTVHEETHGGRKRFKCDVCKKSFRQKGNLQRHVLTHVGTKPFFCEVCGKEFSQRGHLNTHRLIHGGKKPFACDVCGDQFSTGRTYRAHCRNCYGRSGTSVQVVKFFHRSADRKGKSITISVGDKVLGCVDIECRVKNRLPSNSTSKRRRPNGRRRTRKQLSTGTLDSDSNGNSHESCGISESLFSPERVLSDSTLESTPSYRKIAKECPSEIEGSDSASSEGADKIGSTYSAELHFPEGEVQQLFSLSNRTCTEVCETDGKKIGCETSYLQELRNNEAPSEICKANSPEFFPADGKALHFIKLACEALPKTSEANSTELISSEGKAQHFIKLTNEAAN